MYRVKELVEADLLSARSPLLITGYASLDILLSFFAQCFSSQVQANPIRILLGHEPLMGVQWQPSDVPQGNQDVWFYQAANWEYL